MAEAVSGLGYLKKSVTSRFVNADKVSSDVVEAKSVSASQQSSIQRRSYFGTPQTLITGVVTVCNTFEIEDRKAGSDVTYAAGIFTIVTSGTYLVSAVIRFTFNATGRRRVFIADITTPFNAICDQDGPANTGAETIVGVCGFRYLAAGTQIAVHATQTSGGNLTISDPGPGNFNVFRLA